MAERDDETVIEVDARLDMICDLIAGAKNGEFSPVAAAAAVDRVARHLTIHLSRLPHVPGTLPAGLANEVDLLTR